MLFFFHTPVANGFTDVFVQEHRFDMLEAYGCQASFSASVLSIALMWLPLLLMALAVFIYIGEPLH